MIYVIKFNFKHKICPQTLMSDNYIKKHIIIKTILRELLPS